MPPWYYRSRISYVTQEFLSLVSMVNIRQIYNSKQFIVKMISARCNSNLVNLKHDYISLLNDNFGRLHVHAHIWNSFVTISLGTNFFGNGDPRHLHHG